MRDAQASRRRTVRTCRRMWLRLKLWGVSERDKEGRVELNTLLNAIAGRRVSAPQLHQAMHTFCHLGDIEEDAFSAMVALLYVYICVPIWSWPKLHRLNKLESAQMASRR